MSWNAGGTTGLTRTFRRANANWEFICRQLFFVQVLIWARISSATNGSEVISETCLRMARVHQWKQRLIDAQQQLNRFLELGFVVQRFGTGDRVIDLVRRKNQK